MDRARHAPDRAQPNLSQPSRQQDSAHSHSRSLSSRQLPPARHRPPLGLALDRPLRSTQTISHSASRPPSTTRTRPLAFTPSSFPAHPLSRLPQPKPSSSIPVPSRSQFSPPSLSLHPPQSPMGLPSRPTKPTTKSHSIPTSLNQLKLTSPPNLSSSVHSNTTVRPTRTNTANSLDKHPTALKKKHAPSHSQSHSSIHQPIPPSRPKRLINMKEENQRILANINAATLSPPTSPNEPRPTEPPLPPPPPSSSDSSSDSSTSSSSSQPGIRSDLPSTVVPSASLNVFGHRHDHSAQVTTNLTIPTPPNATSGLIPFAKDCSPSPRKITATTHNAPSAVLTSRPAMAPLESLDAEAEAAEDDRLGSVRGKRTERCRLLRRTSPGDNAHPPPPSSAPNTFVVNTPASDQSLDLLGLHQQEQEQAQSKLSKAQITPTDRPPSRAKSAVHQGSHSKRPPPSISTSHSSRSLDQDGPTSLDSMSDHERASGAGSQRSHVSKSSRSEAKSAIRRSGHSRHASKPTSMDTSSSDTIGKTDHSPHPRGSSGPSADGSEGRWASEMGTNGGSRPEDWARQWLDEASDEGEHEDMNTPVKARAQPGPSLRQVSSVSELMVSTAAVGLAGPAGPAVTPRASLGRRRSSSAGRREARPHSEQLVIGASRPTGGDRLAGASRRQQSTRPVMRRLDGAKPSSANLFDHLDSHQSHSCTHSHSLSHSHSLVSQPATPAELCRSSSRSHHIGASVGPQSTSALRHKLISNRVCSSSPGSSSSSSLSDRDPIPNPNPIPNSIPNLNPNLNPLPSPRPQLNFAPPQPNHPLQSHPTNPPSTLAHSKSHAPRSAPNLNSLARHPPQLTLHSNIPSISASNMFSNGHRPRSPAQSHAGSSARRHRPGLPQHFIQSVPSSEYPDSRAPSRAEARRAAEQALSSPRSTRTGPLVPMSPRRHPRAAQRYSDTYTSPLDRPLGVESALAHYDGHHTYSGGRAQHHHHQVLRGKHSTWSVLDDGVGGEILRSQSVLAGVYDPRSTGVRRLGTNAQSSRSPTMGPYHTYRAAGGAGDEDDDGQTSMTTYIHSHSVARKNGSNGSWELEDHEPRRAARTESRLSRRRTADLVSGLVSTPARHRSLLEHDRTLRGSGGARVAAGFPLTHVLARSPQEHRRTPGQLGDQLSSTSSGTSSRRLPGSLQRTGYPAGSAFGSRTAPDSAARHSRLSVRPESAVGMGVAGFLSPTPDVDHHKLLISAYEALERGQEEDSGDGHQALVALLASVVKNSCRIDASLGQLAESSVAAQVEMELMDDEEGDGSEGYESGRRGGRVWRQRCEMMERNVGQMEKAQAQLVRTSNDQIRDLTEVLIWLNTLERSRQRGDEGAGSSRASGRYSLSHSPNKTRHPMGASPLSVISSHDESPLARAKPQQATHEGARSRTEQPQRASTISFTNDRPVSMGAMHQRLRAKHRLSGGGKMNGSLVGSMSSMSLVSQTVRKGLEEQDGGDRRGTVDEFGQMPRRKGPERGMRSVGGGGERSGAAGGADGRTRRHQEAGWTTGETRGGGGKTIRGGSSVVFPRTPPRLATASLSHMTAHSNVSPTKAGERQSMESRTGWREREEAGLMVRPQSSMSVILDRANDVLSRVGYYPESMESPQPQSGRQERFVSGAPVEDSRRGAGRRSVCLSRGGEPSEADEGDDEVERRSGREWQRVTGRGSTAATVALERLSQMGSWHGRPPGSGSRSQSQTRSEEEQEEEEEAEWRRRQSRAARVSVSTYVVGGTESEVDGDQEFDDDEEDDTCQPPPQPQQQGVYRRTGGVSGNGSGSMMRGVMSGNGNGNVAAGGGGGNNGKLGLGKRTNSIQKLFGGMRRGQ